MTIPELAKEMREKAENPRIEYFPESADGPEFMRLFNCGHVFRLLDALDKWQEDSDRIMDNLEEGTLHVITCNANHTGPVGNDMCSCPPGAEIKRLRYLLGKRSKALEVAYEFLVCEVEAKYEPAEFPSKARTKYIERVVREALEEES